MDIFYHGMNYASKGIINASCCGDFKRRNAEEAWQLIEDLAKCNYKAPSEASRSSSRLNGNGLIGLDRMTAIKAKLDVVMNKLGNNERRMHTAHEVGVAEERIRRSAEGLVEEEPYQVEETKYMNEQRSYHFKPNPNLPTHYMSRPDSRSDQIGGSEPSSGRETIYWDSLPDFFFFKAELIPVGMAHIL